jgi:uncharacterized protein YacL
MILLHVLRLFFVLAVVAVGWSLVEPGNILPEQRVFLLLGALVLAAAIVALDVLQPRKSLKALGGLFFGLIVGLVISYGLSLVLNYLRQVYLPAMDQGLYDTIRILIGIICCYLCVSFVLQTKDDIRFVIPYVEFAKQLKGQRPLILDTSVLIDGRIADIADAGIFDQKIVVPRFVLNELHAVADSADRMKRSRGRRGLDILSRLQASPRLDLEVLDEPASVAEPNRKRDRPADAPPPEGVDSKLLTLAQALNGRVVTNDYNLNKVARVRGVEVLNLNDLAQALRPVFLPGEAMAVKVIRPGEEPGQGVGYLDDGTMVVVDGGRSSIGDSVNVVVTSVLQTSAGRMIFARLEGASGPERRRPESPGREAARPRQPGGSGM